MQNRIHKLFFHIINLLLLMAMFSACAPANDTAAVTETNSASAIAPTASDLPPVFQTDLLNPLDTPRAYIQDTCQYLRARWNGYNAEPGTVVMIIMLRNVYGSATEHMADVDESELRKIMSQLKKQGFEAIDTEQFLAFMERNVKIPPRSVLLIRDGNYTRKNFESYFGQYWKDWKWSVVNGWVSRENLSEDLWKENALMEYEGFIDHQAGGVREETFLTEDASKVVIARELQGSLDAFANHFGKTPIAFIWPNGGFGQRPVEIARLLDYQLGFTLNSRGPVMYNWVPLANKQDPQRPSYIPEGAIKDPLMTLPRYYPHQVLSSIDDVRIIGRDAKEHAQANKAAELEYYRTVCEPEYGPIPAP